MSSSGFQPASSYFPDSMRQSVATAPVLADLDGDGRMDLVLRSKYGNTPEVNGTPVHGIQAWHNTVSGWERFATDPLQVDDGAGNLSPLATQGGFAIADIDNDGKLEVVATADTTSDGANFSVWRLDGGALHALTGAANPLAGVTLPDVGKVLPGGSGPGPDSMPGAVALADYDGDGDLDIVVGSESGATGLWALRNTGSGYAVDTTTFAHVALGSNTHIAPSFTDLDGDGHLDLVLQGQGGALSSKYGPGVTSAWTFDTTSGTFEAAATDPFAGISVHRAPVSVFTDLDGDGRQDMVTGDKYGRLSAYHREADGSFTALDTPGSITGAAGQPSFIDLNGDGRLDLVPSLAGAILSGAGGFAPLENTGSGFVPFATNPFTASPPTIGRAVAIDLDGDGDKDIAFAGTVLYGVQPAQAFENQGGTYLPFGTDPFAGIAGAHEWAATQVGDVNGDGRDDLVVLEASGALRVLRGTAGGLVEDTSDPLNGFAPGVSSATGFAHVDLDDDGDLDLAVSNVAGQLFTFENQGGSYAAFATNPISGGGPIGALPLWNGPVFTDVDGDGRLDFVGTDASLASVKYGDPQALLARQTPAVWLHTDTGWTKMDQAENPYRTIAMYPMALPLLTFADLDGDGHVEAMQSEKYGTTSLVGVVGLQLKLGSAAPEALDGTADDDIVRGFNGADTINGLDGDDVLAGGAGADQLNGGNGSDTADYNDSGAAVRASLVTNRGVGGDAEGDRYTSIENLAGSGFDDLLQGNGAANLLDGRAGKDSLSGGAGADTLLGGADADRLSGGDDGDVLDGGSGDDVLRGEAGADSLAGGADADVLSGGDGADTLAGDAGQDTLLGEAGTDSLSGGDGNDSLVGGGDADTLAGEVGNDSMQGGDGDDVLRGGLGADTVFGQAGHDIFVFGSAAEGGDVIRSYDRADDVIHVSAAGFGGGLLEGVAAPFVANLTGLSTSAAGVGQFIWEKDAKVLWWDDDGAGADAAVAIASFAGIVGGGNAFNAAEILVIA